MAGRAKKLCVLGAGVVGLSTAVQLQQAWPDAHVTVIADRFNRDTVSDGAAGSFRVTGDLTAGVPRDTLKRWCVDSFAYYDSVAQSAEAAEAGVSVVNGHHFNIDQPKEKDPLYSEVVYDYQVCSASEQRLYPNAQNAHHAVSFTTLMVECRWFLPWLMKRFIKAGGQVHTRKIKSLEELVGLFDVVVNCTGYGSADLLGDTKLKTIRGQMIRVNAPWIKRFLYVDNQCWIIPGKETVIIGGTRQEGDQYAGIRASDSAKLWETACKYVPSLRSAKWEWEWVGMRPVREPIRLERETFKFGNIPLHVVHNYGHGGNGVSLAWGTAKQAVQLVNETLLDLQPAKL